MQYLLVESSGCSAPPVDKKMPRFRPETRPGQTPYFIFLEVTHNLIFLALHVFYSHWNKVCVCACMHACMCVCSLYLAIIFHPHQNIHQNHSNCPKHFCHCKLSKPNDIKQHGAPHGQTPNIISTSELHSIQFHKSSSAKQSQTAFTAQAPHNAMQTPNTVRHDRSPLHSCC